MPNKSADKPMRAPDEVMRVAWTKQLRDELKSTDRDESLEIVNHPDEWGVLWRRVDTAFSGVWAILDAWVRESEGEDPSQLVLRSVDEAVIMLQDLNMDIQGFADRIDDLGRAELYVLRRSAAHGALSD